MLRNVSFLAVTAFWVTMNALLWRAEFGAGQDLAASVPVAAVWEKILKSPDDSQLSILRQGKRLGYLRLRPNVGEEQSTGKVASENEPEGIVRRLSEYTLEIEGSVLAEIIGRAIRLTANFRFDPALHWKNFHAQASIRPTLWQISGDAAKQELWVQTSDGDAEWIRSFNLALLSDPRALARELDSPILSAILEAGPSPGGGLAKSRFGLQWEARTDWLRIGRNKVRVYRLEARLPDGLDPRSGRHQIVVLVSRVGEILKIELPGEFRLVNEVLFAT